MNNKIKIPKSIAKKYAGLTAAVIGNNVVAGAASTSEAIAKAKKKFPKIPENDIGIMTLPPREGVWVLKQNS